MSKDASAYIAICDLNIAVIHLIACSIFCQEGNIDMLTASAALADTDMGVLLPLASSASAKQQEIVSEVLAALKADQLELPVLPDMAFKVRALLADPDSSTGQFVQLISNDLAISLYLIKAANVAALSNGKPVGNLSDAIPRLGYRMLYSMVLNITLTRLFHASNPVINQKLKELWEHSRVVAANSYVLAQEQSSLKPEDAILAGLVHEIGALPLYLYADRYHPEMDPVTLEGLISTFSPVVGFRLLQSWNFPDALVDIAAEQLGLWIKPQSDVPDYVDVVTMAKLQTHETDADFSWRNIPAAERLGYYPGDCKNFMINHADQFAVVNQILGIGE